MKGLMKVWCQTNSDTNVLYELSLREKCLCSVQMRENTGQKISESEHFSRSVCSGDCLVYLRPAFLSHRSQSSNLQFIKISGLYFILIWVDLKLKETENVIITKELNNRKDVMIFKIKLYHIKTIILQP